MVEAPELPELLVLIEVTGDDRRLLAVRFQFEAKHRAGQRLIVEGETERRLERAMHHHAEADEAECGERLAEGVFDHEGVADLVASPQERLPRLPIADVTARLRWPFALELDEGKDLARAPAALESQRDERRHRLQWHDFLARRGWPQDSPVSGPLDPWRKLSRFLAASVLGGLPVRFRLGEQGNAPARRSCAHINGVRAGMLRETRGARQAAVPDAGVSAMRDVCEGQDQ